MSLRVIKFAIAASGLAAAATACAFAGEWTWAFALATGAAFTAKDLPAAVKR